MVALVETSNTSKMENMFGLMNPLDKIVQSYKRVILGFG